MKKDIRERFTLRIPSELFELLQKEAKRTGVSINALILQVLWEHYRAGNNNSNQ